MRKKAYLTDYSNGELGESWFWWIYKVLEDGREILIDKVSVGRNESINDFYPGAEIDTRTYF